MMMTKKLKPVGWNDSANPAVEKREIEWGGFRSAVGRSTVKAECPFCGDSVTAYLWSLSGGGKRCKNDECKALLGTRTALQWKEKIGSNGARLDNNTRHEP